MIFSLTGGLSVLSVQGSGEPIGEGREEMEDAASQPVPVWTLGTEPVNLPRVADDGAMTSQRLTALRTALAYMAESPIATLEVHPLPRSVDRGQGISLGSDSPLAKQLSDLVGRCSGPGRAGSGEALYRMVVPANVASRLGSGLITPMMSKAVPNGIHSALVGRSGIAAQAAFVPVAGTAGMGAITVAPVLIVMGLATGLSMRSEVLRREEHKQIREQLEKLHEDRLDDERNELDSCIKPIEKASAIVLDQAVVGKAIGLDTAVSKIETAIAAARRRLARWQKSFSGLPVDRVEVAVVKKAFPGIADAAGEFRAHLDLAKLAITLKRRVIILQAVEQAQLNPGEPFERFIQALAADEKELDELETAIAKLLRQLSALPLDRTHGLRDFMFTPGEVDDLLKLSSTLRQLGDSLDDTGRRPSDIVIEMIREDDGSVVVLPALTQAS
jgi:hypothetical protein